jgi:hypothetical protein
MPDEIKALRKTVLVYPLDRRERNHPKGSQQAKIIQQGKILYRLATSFSGNLLHCVISLLNKQSIFFAFSTSRLLDTFLPQKQPILAIKTRKR